MRPCWIPLLSLPTSPQLPSSVSPVSNYSCYPFCVFKPTLRNIAWILEWIYLPDGQDLLAWLDNIVVLTLLNRTLKLSQCLPCVLHYSQAQPIVLLQHSLINHRLQGISPCGSDSTGRRNICCRIVWLQSGVEVQRFYQQPTQVPNFCLFHIIILTY